MKYFKYPAENLLFTNTIAEGGTYTFSCDTGFINNPPKAPFFKVKLLLKFDGSVLSQYDITVVVNPTSSSLAPITESHNTLLYPNRVREGRTDLSLNLDMKEVYYII